MLRINNLVVRYGQVEAVRGVTMHVDEGEMVALVGANGAGKTSILSVLAGLVPAARGEAELSGWSLLGEPPETIVRRGMVLVPSGRRIFPSLTVAENLAIGASSRRRDGRVQQDIEAELVRFPVLRKCLRTPAGKLSGGEQQQLVIARALLARPELLALDEPTLGLAPRMVDLVFDSLEELRSHGVTILLVEQNARRSIEIADRAYVLALGHVRLEGTAATLRSYESELEDAYLGRGG